MNDKKSICTLEEPMETKHSMDLAEAIFEIHCEDIILCEYLAQDLEAIYAITHEPEIVEFLPGWNVAKSQRQDWLLNYEIVENKAFLSAVQEQQDIGELRLRLTITLKETGELIGWCCTGIKDNLRVPEREIMFAVSNQHTNKGYATQAMRGLTDYLFNNTEVNKLVALALLRNAASNAVIRKSGFHYTAVVELDNEEYRYYELYRHQQ
jgi:[ribosomal protein S5]-alanine N-acetyltransferase